jgi:DNA-3-methyladenine glycosylase II
MSPEYLKARRHLGRRDATLKPLIAVVGPCTLQPTPDGFRALVRSIVAQQISTKAAQSIGGRLEGLLAPKPLTPRGILGLTEEALRGAGLSASKVRSVRDLAEKVHTKAVPLAKLHALDDDEVIAALIPVRGIGRWTAEMFLIFSLGRPDVLPVDDLGLRAAVRDLYRLPDLPDKNQLASIAEPWRPYRSIATWYLWRSRGFVPQSDAAKEKGR